MRRSLVPALIATFVVVPAVAHAEQPTSWLAAGPSVSVQHDNLDARNTFGLAVSAEIGVGTVPTHPFVVGAIFRTLTTLSLGTDLSLSARVATSGFVRGNWGVAVDLGIAARWWAHQEYGHFPLQAVGILGLPAGLQLELGAQVWDVTGDQPTAKGGFALFSLDLFRLASSRAHAQVSFFGSDPPPQLQVIEHTIEQPNPPPPSR